MTINVWLALRDDAQALIRARLSWDEETQGEYSGPITDRQHKLFKLMHDLETTQKLFRVDAGARDWTIWNLYFDLPNNILLKVQNEIDALIVAFPNHIKIIGAWKWNGTQIPAYPLHARILEFMPDIVTYDENGNETSRVRPTVPSDVNLGLGQTPRQF